jgi:hypothetical protein
VIGWWLPQKINGIVKWLEPEEKIMSNVQFYLLDPNTIMRHKFTNITSGCMFYSVFSMPMSTWNLWNCGHCLLTCRLQHVKARKKMQRFIPVERWYITHIWVANGKMYVDSFSDVEDWGVRDCQNRWLISYTRTRISFCTPAVSVSSALPVKKLHIVTFRIYLCFCFQTPISP